MQLGGKSYSQIIFFEDKRAFDEFTSGKFEFGAEAQAVVVTAGASAKGSTTGSSASASGGKKDAKTAGGYYKGMATFQVAKGGLMGGVNVGGQKFTYKRRSRTVAGAAVWQRIMPPRSGRGGRTRQERSDGGRHGRRLLVGHHVPGLIDPRDPALARQ